MGEVGGGGDNNISGYILQYYYISRRTADALSNEVVRAKYTYTVVQLWRSRNQSNILSLTTSIVNFLQRCHSVFMQ